MQQAKSPLERRLEGRISAYQTFVVHVMKLSLSAEKIDRLLYLHEHATLPPDMPPEDTDFVAGVAEGDQEVIRLIRENRGQG